MIIDIMDIASAHDATRRRVIKQNALVAAVRIDAEDFALLNHCARRFNHGRSGDYRSASNIKAADNSPGGVGRDGAGWREGHAQRERRYCSHPESPLLV